VIICDMATLTTSVTVIDGPHPEAVVLDARVAETLKGATK